jgi:hypothetical protein
MISLRELLFEKQFPETKGLYAGPYGKYYSSPDFNPSSYMGKISNGKWVPKVTTTSTKKTKPTTQQKAKRDMMHGRLEAPRMPRAGITTSCCMQCGRRRRSGMMHMRPDGYHMADGLRRGPTPRR